MTGAIVLSLLVVAGCSRQLLSVVFDLPPRAAVSDTATVIVQASTLTFAVADTVRPPIGQLFDPDSVRSMLPRDHAGNIDWVAALRTGVIKPRAFIPGDSLTATDQDYRFGFDFYLPGPAPTLDAYFPHSAHTEWIDCQQCHPRIFRYRDTEIKMADVLQGKYCGECHGKVAFPPVTGCERCHTGLPQQPNRAQPELLGTIQMMRASRTDVDTDAVAAQNAAPDSLAPPPITLSSESLPAATFPHWIHRIRYKCKVCHTKIFEPKAGANLITMADINAGQFCGRCHNGKTAFAAGFGACQRCHKPPEVMSTH